MEKSNIKFHTELPKTELSKQFWEENIKVDKCKSWLQTYYKA